MSISGVHSIFDNPNPKRISVVLLAPNEKYKRLFGALAAKLECENFTARVEDCPRNLNPDALFDPISEAIGRSQFCVVGIGGRKAQARDAALAMRAVKKRTPSVAVVSGTGLEALQDVGSYELGRGVNGFSFDIRLTVLTSQWLSESDEVRQCIGGASSYLCVPWKDWNTRIDDLATHIQRAAKKH
jgi:hypothetical protein